jgi:hypothetical protein
LDFPFGTQETRNIGFSIPDFLSFEFEWAIVKMRVAAARVET